MLIGDRIERILSSVGITQERVEAVVGKGCGCPKRKATLNKMHVEARVLLRARKSAVYARVRHLRRTYGTVSTRIKMSWNCLRYGNPHHRPTAKAADALLEAE